MSLQDELDDLRDQLDSRPPMVKYGDKPGLTIPNPDMNNNLDTVVVGGDVAIEAARIAITAGDDAFTSKQSAEQSATLASDAATTAVDAKDIVVAAETVVVDAKNEAVQANTDAQEAKDIAVAARDETVAAKDILVPAIDETLEARDQAVAASTTAVGAADTATTKAGEAVISAEQAEFWADAAEASSGVAGLGETIAGLPKIKPILNLDFINQKQLLKGVNFSRATPTWDWDEHGNFRKYEIDEPVFAYDPVTGEAKGLQVYPVRTNLFVNSVNMPIESTPLITQGGLRESVNGWGVFTKGVKLTAPSSAAYYYSNAPLTVGTTYTFSAYVSVEGGGKPNVEPGQSNVNADVSFAAAGGGSPNTLYTHILGDIWQVTNTFTKAEGFNNVGLVKYTGQSSKAVTVYGYQLEVGSKATPHIPTEGSQVTVAATLKSDSLNNITVDEFTIVFYKQEHQASGGVSLRDIEIFDDADTSLIVLQQSATTPTYNLSGTLATIPVLSNMENSGLTAIAYNRGVTMVYFGGELIGVSDPIEHAQVTIGHISYGVGNTIVGGYHKATKLYPRALSDIELKELTK